LGAAYIADDITWWENNGSETFTPHTIDENFNGAISVRGFDIDGDGDMDVLACGWDGNEVAWWENNGSETFTKRSIDNAVSNPYCIHAADIDNDGDLDVMAAVDTGGDIIWWANDGSPADGGWVENSVDNSFVRATGIYAADMDIDGDLDILGAAYTDDDITWWENNNSLGTNWTEHTIDADFDAAISVYAVDIDEDGDMDVLGAANGADDITLWRNNMNPYVGEQRIQHSIPRNRWSIAGIPVNVADGSPGTLFQDDFGGSAPNGDNWRISRWDTENEGYIRYEEENSIGVPAGNPPAFTPGLGFWVSQNAVDNAVMDITSAQHTGVVDQSTRFQVQLEAPGAGYRGYNLFANPFDYIYDWRQTWVYNATDDLYKTIFEAAAANWISGYGYAYNGWDRQYRNINFRGDSTANYTLNAWEGIWIEQLVESKTLYVEFVPACMLDSEPPEVPEEYRGTEDAGGWQFALQVASADGEYYDECNIIGIDPMSADDYDLFDAMEFTPNAGEFVQLYFEHQDWPMEAYKFTYDFRSMEFNGGVKEWDFTVRGWNLEGEDFVLSWGNLDGIPKRYNFTLEKTDVNAQPVDMREASQYSFTGGSEANDKHYFSLTVTDGGAPLAPALDNIKFGLKSAYPNPSNDQMRITFGLPEMGKVELKVFNVLGREGRYSRMDLCPPASIRCYGSLKGCRRRGYILCS